MAKRKLETTEAEKIFFDCTARCTLEELLDFLGDADEQTARRIMRTSRFAYLFATIQGTLKRTAMGPWSADDLVYVDIPYKDWFLDGFTSFGIKSDTIKSLKHDYEGAFWTNWLQVSPSERTIIRYADAYVMTACFMNPTNSLVYSDANKYIIVDEDTRYDARSMTNFEFNRETNSNSCTVSLPCPACVESHTWHITTAVLNPEEDCSFHDVANEIDFVEISDRDGPFHGPVPRLCRGVRVLDANEMIAREAHFAEYGYHDIEDVPGTEVHGVMVPRTPQWDAIDKDKWVVRVLEELTGLDLSEEIADFDLRRAGMEYDPYPDPIFRFRVMMRQIERAIMESESFGFVDWNKYAGLVY